MCGRARLPADYAEIKIAFELGDAPAPNLMPVILAPADWPVDRRVGNVRNNDAGLVEGIALDAEGVGAG